MDKEKILLNKILVIFIIILFLNVTASCAIGMSNTDDDITPPVTIISFDPPEPNGFDNWYVSNVNVTLNATDDLSGVKEIHYRVAEGEWYVYFGNFVVFILDYDCLIDGLIEYYSVDFSGNIEDTKSFCCIDIDKIPPNIEFDYEVKQVLWWTKLGGYEIIFSATVEDECSGPCGRIEFYLNNQFQQTVEGPGPTYTWCLIYFPIPNATLKAITWDNAGNIGIAVINLSDIHSRTSINFITRFSNNLWLLRFFYRFQFLNKVFEIFGGYKE